MSKKKKILLLSDDLRMHSGIATVSKDIVMETLNEYDWVQVAGAIKHPDHIETIDKELGKIAEFEDRLEVLRKYFKEKQVL